MRSSAYPLILFLLGTLLAGGCAKHDPPTINLYRAIQAGDLDQIKRHLYHDTDINQPDRNGDTPLHVAANRGKPVIARMLVEHGAGLETPNGDGRSPMAVALLSGKIQVARLLLKFGAALDAQALLFEAIRSQADYRDLYEFLHAQGADPNAADGDGLTPLLAAIEAGDRLVTKRLIDLGADVNQRGSDDRSPLTAALGLDDQDIARLLKRNGAVENP